MSKRALAHLRLEGYSDADFRTTFGTQMKEYGKTSAEVADLMGHADTRMVGTGLRQNPPWEGVDEAPVRGGKNHRKKARHVTLYVTKPKSANARNTWVCGP